MLPSDLASGVVVEAFAATVTYRLEPDGPGSRFPVVLDHLLGGRLSPRDAPAALAELEAIAAGLRTVPREQVVFSLGDLSRRDDADARVDRSARDAHGFFVAEDGRPLVEALREGVLASLASGRPLGISTPRSEAAARSAWLVLAVGLAWAVCGFLFLPHLVLVPLGASRNAHGPAAWTLGLLAAGAGAVQLAAARRPAVASALRRHGLLAAGAGLAATAIVFFLAWR